MRAKGGHHGLGALVGLPLGFGLACRGSRGFAAFALDGMSRPVMLALHRLTARVAFPVAEPLALGALAALLATLAAAGARAASERQVAALRRWLRGACLALLGLGSGLLALWLPAMAQPVDAPPPPDAERLEWLCGELIDALNASDLAFPQPGEGLRIAPRAAGLPEAVVKVARYPEWMRAAAVSGLFVPLTGEALADATVPAPLIPFTAVHELMHLTGIADEGAANIAAWERCMATGGAFADSARLWALRYGMGLLRQADADAWTRTRGNMKDPLAQVFQASGGELSPSARVAPGLPRLSLSRGDYTALLGYLADSIHGGLSG